MRNNRFLNDLLGALENQEPTDEIMNHATGVGDPDLEQQDEAINAPDGNTGAPGDDGNPVGHDDPDRDPEETELESQDIADDETGNPPSPGDGNGSADPESSLESFMHMMDMIPGMESDNVEEDEPGGFPDTLDGFNSEVKLHKNRNEIPLEQEKDAKDDSGNTGDPATNKQTPVTPSGDTKVVRLDDAVLASYDKSGNTGDPTGTGNGSPVSKSGDSKEIGLNEFEKAADDKDGSPDSPGVDAEPAPSFEAFISACEQMRITKDAGVVCIPQSMSLEAYALELGYGQIAAMAMEAKLTAAERKALKDSDFALPENRQWPIHDEAHVRSAIQNFHWAPKDKQREIATNILKAMRKFKMKKVQVSEGNPFLQYYPDAQVVPRKKPARKGSGK